MPQNKKDVDNKRTFKGKKAIMTFILEKALKHDVRLAFEIIEKYAYDDTRLTMNGETVLVCAREGQIKKGKDTLSL